MALPAHLLSARWAGARRFVVLEAGFGWGHQFLATWQAWRRDPQACGQLVFVSLEPNPPSASDLALAHSVHGLPGAEKAERAERAERPDAAHMVQARVGSPPAPLIDRLLAAWPPLTDNLHLLDFEGGRVRLLLAAGPAAARWRRLRLQADAFCLPGTAPDGQNKPWDGHRCKALARLARPGARVHIRDAGSGLDSALRSAGFVVEAVAAVEASAERDAVTVARYSPSFPPRRATRMAASPSTTRHALIIGAGISGACTAAALARQGWQCTVLDSATAPAAGASGNPAALFHGTVHAVDGPHARFTRAAALHAHRVYAALIAAGVPGSVQGLLRAHVAPTTASAGARPPPPGWAQVWAGSGLQTASPGLRAADAWFYPQGGWVDAAATVRALLATPGVQFRGCQHVVALRRQSDLWQALGDDGRVLAQAGVVVLAHAGAGTSDIHALLHSAGAAAWPATRVRGQVTWFQREELDPPALPRPVAGLGYAVSLPSGALLCGATSQTDDNDPTVRAADHHFNLSRLQALTGLQPAAGAALQGRVGWREQTPDRLPMLGAAPSATWPDGARLDQPRLVPRVPGLFLVGAMAGRGFTWGPLAAEVLAATLEGAPLPLEADLLDAVDPARWVARHARRAQAADQAATAAYAVPGGVTVPAS